MMKFTKEDIKVFQDSTYYMEPHVNIEYVPLSKLREAVKELKHRNRRRLRNKDIDELFGEVGE
jgi:hypothetical protein